MWWMGVFGRLIGLSLEDASTFCLSFFCSALFKILFDELGRINKKVLFTGKLQYS